MANEQLIRVQKELGEKLKNARLKANLTQEEIVKDMGITSNYYAKIERGEINITLDTLYKILKALKIEASEIVPS